ncbi:TolC family protein [Glaesserella sp.]|uniref:toxin/drug exporter TdeA n=2 Tax=Glaesserella sp. TaxID=2094731 RepID=UPI0035A18FCE
MQLSKLTLILVTALAVSACSNRMSQDGSLEKAQQNYQQYQDITKEYQITEQWWLGYNDKELNRLVEMALLNNVDLAKAAITVNKALYNANLVGADLVPTFSGSESSSVSKGTGSPSTNSVSTGTSTLSHQLGFNLSYTLDLWRRLADTASASEWEYKATQQDLLASRLSLINSVISSYYNLAYYQDAIRVTEQSIKNYEQISKILSNKLNVGAIDPLSVDQSIQSVLSAKNTLISLKSAQKSAEQTLRNLLNLKPNEPLVVRYPSILSVKLQGVDMNVPVSVIAARPDVVASLQRLQSSFKTLTATEKSWFPTITLGGSLSSSAAKLGDVTDNPVAGGSISFSLPFLDWYRVQNNIKISEESYKSAKLDYEQTVTSALNEIDTYYVAYQLSRDSFDNLQKKYDYDRRISGYYKNRYDQGVSELREWLSAINTERSSELSLLETKYTILKNENAVYQAMAGKYRR